MTKARTLADNFAADINGITAGTGITGGGTSGTVTITNSMATEIDAKGDLVVGTGADTFARLPVGTNGYTLVADSVETTGLKWVASSTNMVLLDSGTLSGASVTTATLSTAYKELQVYVKQWRPATDSAYLYLRWNGLTDNYNYEIVDGGNATAGMVGNTFVRISRQTDNGTSRAFTWLIFPDYSNTTTMKMGRHQTISQNATNPTTEFSYNQGMTMNYDTAAITSFTFFPSTGNHTSGSYEVYGVK